MKSWQLLGYLGLLPFIACLYLSIETVDLNITAKQAFIAYSAIIISFISGTLWRKNNNSTYVNQQIISNIVSLIAFVTLLIEPDVALIILAFSFLFLFIFEKKSAIYIKENSVITGYMSMRLWLTLMVVSLHIIAYGLWFF
ncbi:MAG: hypothetical protein ACI9LM_001576 [Alteromonadaceae bacterium]|jgi:hypothetical protein